MSSEAEAKIELRSAFLWTCDNCGRDQFERAVEADIEMLPEADREAIRSHPGIDMDASGFDFLMKPTRVACEVCGSAYAVEETTGLVLLGDDGAEAEPPPQQPMLTVAELEEWAREAPDRELAGCRVLEAVAQGYCDPGDACLVLDRLDKPPLWLRLLSPGLLLAGVVAAIVWQATHGR